MSILITGSTGHTGLEVVRLLVGQGVPVRALTRSPEQVRFPAGVTPVKGDLSDVDVVARALEGTDTLFLLAPNMPDEFHQTLTTLDLARDAGIRGIVFLSVFECDRHADVPHFACKVAAERMIEQCGLPASILRPTFFMQNDLRQKVSIMDHGCYGMPLGNKGIAAIDTRDLAEVAARELLRRHSSKTELPMVRHNVVGPDNLTSLSIIATWSEALGREISYAGDDLDAFSAQARAFLPPGLAYDLRMMLKGFQQHGEIASPDDVSRMAKLLGRPPRSYADFVAETVREWKQA
jgi:Predicted nucleoside-diphosphate-sugar epimerases